MPHASRRSRIGALGTIGLMLAGGACHDDREPTGLSGLRGVDEPARDTAVYPDERRTVELAREIPGLAGFFYDTSANIIVTVKDLTRARTSASVLQPKFGKELARARRRNPHAILILRSAAYAFLDLKGWRDRLMDANVLSLPGVVWLDLDEVANRVVIGLDAGGDPAVVRAATRNLGIPPEALDFESSGPLIRQQTLRDTFRPIVGGIQIQRVSGTSRIGCTLGFTAQWNNQQVFLTAGHCSPNLTGTDSVAQYQPLAPLTHSDSLTMGPIGREIFQYSTPCGNRRCSYSDAAIYGLIPSQTWGIGHIARPTYGCALGPCNPPNLTVTANPWVIDTTRESFVINDLVSEIGAATGWSQGFVQRTCVNVAPVSGVQYNCQMFASYGSGDGDSGAPILLDVGPAQDSTVTLGGIHSGRSGKNAVFSPWSGIMQDYGRLVVVAAPLDTIWPVVTDTLPRLDTTRLVQVPSGRLLYRANVQLRFKDGVSNAAKAAFFSRHNMTVVAVTRSGNFFVGIPDPGSLSALDGLLDQLNAEPEILAAAELNFSPLEPSRDYRYPVDGPGQSRSDWISNTSTWAMRAIRAPLAWGCETGAYGGSLPAVGLFEWKHQRTHPEFALSSPVLWEPPDAPLAHIAAWSPARVDSNEQHAAGTTGLLAAEGNNASGIAGVAWRTGLHLYAGLSSPGNHPLPIPDNFFALAQAVERHQLRVLSFSADAVVDSSRPPAERVAMIRRFAVDIQRDLLDASPSLLVVVAAGNDRYRGTDTAYAGDNKATVIRAALLLVRSNPAYRDRILVVAGTMSNNAFWDLWSANPTKGSNFYTGATDIAAPAQDVTVLDRWTGQTGSAVPLRTATGTSLSAPLVAGVAGLLLVMDSTLTSAQVKDLILRGARQPRLNTQTGQVVPPAAVSGAPETVYQLDAYGALTLLAQEHRGIPLCGNRVWTAANTVYARRDSLSPNTEQLTTLSEPASRVNAFHGGRRIQIDGDTSFWTRQIVYDAANRRWQVTDSVAPGLSGGTFLSTTGWSHDRDSLVVLGATYAPSGDATVQVQVWDTATQVTRLVTTIAVPLTNSTDSTCYRQSPGYFNYYWVGDPDTGHLDSTFVSDVQCRAYRRTGASRAVALSGAFSPTGGQVLAAVTRSVYEATSFGGWATCPWDHTGRQDADQCRSITYESRPESTSVWRINLPNGQPQPLWGRSGQVFWLGVAEQGGEIVAGEGVVRRPALFHPTTDGFYILEGQALVLSGCGVSYSAQNTGVLTIPFIADDRECLSSWGSQGTMAPIRTASR